MENHRIRAFKNRAERAGIFLDFDGTLSHIVPVPSEARPAEGIKELLSSLAARFAVVAVVSGRSAHELVSWLGDEVEIWGLHGAQTALGGRVSLSKVAAPFEELMRTVLHEATKAIAAAGLPGLIVEDKAVIVTLHYRNAEDRERGRTIVGELAAELAARHGLTIATGRMSLELRPPTEFSKAAVVLERARRAELDAVAFAGDDVVDLPAFDALDRLEDEGVLALRVAVNSEEAPPELLDRADLVVSGPDGVVDLLRELAG